MNLDIDVYLQELLQGRLPPIPILIQIINSAKDLFLKLPNIVQVSSPCIIIGDLHGQFYDFLHILNRSRFFQSPTSLIFLGDVVDRGYYSTETITLILLLKLKYKDLITLIRGNHESKQISQVYGFYDELRHRVQSAGMSSEQTVKGFGLFLSPTKPNDCLLSPVKEGNSTSSEFPSQGPPKDLFRDSFELSRDLNDSLGASSNQPASTSGIFGSYSPSPAASTFGESGVSLWRIFLELFDVLPISACIDGRHFCVHGGLPRTATSLDALSSLNRLGEIPFDGDLCDLLWSDPVDSLSLSKRLWEPNSRGAGIIFGEELFKEFVRKNGVEKVYRSHQLVMEGYKRHWKDGKMVTVWSAPNYCYRCGNRGSVAKVSGGREEEFDVFSAVEDSERGKPKEEERMDFIREI